MCVHCSSLCKCEKGRSFKHIRIQIQEKQLTLWNNTKRQTLNRTPAKRRQMLVPKTVKQYHQTQYDLTYSDQYFTNSPFLMTSSLYRRKASFNEYWNITLFTTYATGKQRKGVTTKESHSTLLNTVMVSVPWPNIFGNISLNIISWHMPVSFWQTTYHGEKQ